MIQIKSKTVAHSSPDFSSNAVTQTAEPFQSSIQFPVFQSTKECPQYTDVEGCTKLGTLAVDIQDPSEEMRDFRVNIIFGNTMSNKSIITSIKINSKISYECFLKRRVDFRSLVCKTNI
jgi:hypothetical protein